MVPLARGLLRCPYRRTHRLAVEDIRIESGVHIMDLRETKTGVPRTVPIHEHLIEQGFLGYAVRIGSGPLVHDAHCAMEIA
jgi:hypothetical protein